MITVARDPAALSAVLLIVRLFLGGMIFTYGFQMVFRNEGLLGVAKRFDAAGIRPGLPNAKAAAYTEMAVGVLLVLGLATPLAAAGLVGLMVSAGAVHVKNGFLLTNPGGGYEYCLAIAIMALVPGTVGAGSVSLDHLFGIFTPGRAFTYLLITLVLGLVTGLAHLALFYRPPKSA